MIVIDCLERSFAEIIFFRNKHCFFWSLFTLKWACSSCPINKIRPCKLLVIFSFSQKYHRLWLCTFNKWRICWVCDGLVRESKIISRVQIIILTRCELIYSLLQPHRNWLIKTFKLLPFFHRLFQDHLITIMPLRSMVCHHSFIIGFNLFLED